MESAPAYRRRIVDGVLDDLWPALPALALEGAKAVGKTATASQRATTTHQLDDPGQREIAEANPDRLSEVPPPILFDEWQRVPAVWDRVRRAVDRGVPPGTFLFTGSASPSPGGTHSGSGRIVSVRMRPLSLAERLTAPTTVSLAALLTGRRPEVRGTTSMRLEDYTEEILRSGFPGLRDLTERPLRSQLDGYVARVVDRDFPELGHQIRNPVALRRWLTAYAAATSTASTWSTIRHAASGGEDSPPSKTTVLPYRDVLERLFILDAVPGWQPTRNRINELGLPPKHHLADPALAARLLGATADGLLDGRPLGPVLPRDGTLLGALFESLVTLSVRVYAEALEASVGHLRTHRGEHEIDLIVERADRKVIAIEVKLSVTVDDQAVRHLKWLAGRLGDDLLDSVVITTGSEAYRRADGIAVVPAALLGV